MRKTLVKVSVFVLTLVLGLMFCVISSTSYSAHAEDHELSDAAIAESNLAFMTASLATVLGLAVVAKQHLVSKIRI